MSCTVEKETSETAAAMDCEEAVCNEEQTQRKETEVSYLTQTEELAEEEMLDGVEIVYMDESNEEVEMISVTQAEEFDVVTLDADDSMETTDEQKSSSANQSDETEANLALTQEIKLEVVDDSPEQISSNQSDSVTHSTNQNSAPSASTQESTIKEEDSSPKKISSDQSDSVAHSTNQNSAPSASTQESNLEEASQEQISSNQSGLVTNLTSQNSAAVTETKITEEPEAGDSSQESAGKTKVDDDPITTATHQNKASLSTTPVLIDSANESGQESSSSSPSKESSESDQTKSVASNHKPSLKVTKTIPLPKTTTSSGKMLNIKILPKDQKCTKNITMSSSQTPVKYTVAPNILNKTPVKMPPLILPKLQPISSKKTTTGSPNSSIPSQTLHKVLVPKNYVLVQTSSGFSFMPADEAQKKGLNTYGAGNQKILSFSGPQNVSILNTSTSSSVSIVNAPITQNTSFPQTSTPKGKIPIPKLVSIGSPVNAMTNTSRPSRPVPPLRFNANSPLLLSSTKALNSQVHSSRLNSQSERASASISNAGLAHDHTEAKKLHSYYPDECQHPTCCTYRDKLYEELRTKLNNRSRRLKSLRMAKERCVKRAAGQLKTVKHLQRQRIVQKAVENLPDSLCKTLMRAQLKPNEGVRAKRLYEKELKVFATQLNSISPKAYNFVRSIFSKVLPDSKAIPNWNFSGVEDSAEVVEEAEKAATTDEEEETDPESEGDEEMLDEEES